MTQENKRFWKGQRVFVTGHEGFLGSWLTRFLVGENATVIGLDINRKTNSLILKDIRHQFKSIYGDVADPKVVEQIFKQFKPQYVFHLAAEAIVGIANKNPRKTFRSNIEGTWNLLEILRNKSHVKAVVVASSDKAYGSHKILPYTEKAALQGEHPYDVSKSCADLICRSYALSFGTPVCITRCGNIYGPGDYNFSRLIPDAIRHIVKGQQFKIRSNGKFTRDYIFVKDVVKAYLLLAQKMTQKNLRGEAFNFSYERPVSVIEIYEKIQKVSRLKPIKPKILNIAQQEIAHQYLTSEKAKTQLGWQPTFNLEDGLLQTFHWYQMNLKRM